MVLKEIQQVTYRARLHLKPSIPFCNLRRSGFGIRKLHIIGIKLNIGLAISSSPLGAANRFFGELVVLAHRRGSLTKLGNKVIARGRLALRLSSWPGDGSGRVGFDGWTRKR